MSFMIIIMPTAILLSFDRKNQKQDSYTQTLLVTEFDKML